MELKYGGSIGKDDFRVYCEVYLANRIFKIKPLKEEGKDWELYLTSLMQELIGASVLIANQHYFGLVSKLEGLKSVEDEESFRRIWLECVSYAKTLPDKIGDDNELA